MDEFKIARLQLQPSDTLVVKAVDLIISDQAAERVRQQVSAATGHDRVMVIDSTIDLSVLTAEQVAELTAH